MSANCGDGDQMLSIDVVQGKDLLEDQKDGSCDAYVVVQYGSLELKTEEVKETLHPKWLSRFEIPIRFDCATVRFWVFSGKSLLGKVDISLNLALARKSKFSLPKQWYDVEPVELSAACLGLSHAKEPEAAFVVSAKEDRHLFDLYDQRETNNRLGAIQVEIKPCDDDVDIAACGCLGAPGDPTFLCQDEPEELMPPPKG